MYMHHFRNYKKMLLCIHTVLTNCYTEENIEIVQHKLGYDWVIKINSMCDIQSNSSNHFKSQQDINSKNILKHGDKDVKLQHEEKGNFNISTPKESELLGKLTKYVLLNKHSHDTDVEIITMFVFRTALQTTKQSGSMPNSWNGADVQKLQKLERMQKSRPSNLLEMIISYCTTINKGFKLAKQDFLAQSENFSNRNGSVRHFSWQVVIFISAVNYLYNFV